MDYRLFEIALSTGEPWPVVPEATAGPCPTGDAACLAYQWISTRITMNPAIRSVRETYTVITSPFSTYSVNLDALAYDPATSHEFDRETFDAVKRQLALELLDAAAVTALLNQYNELMTDFAVEQTGELISAYDTIVNSIRVPSSSNTEFDVEAVLRTLTMVGAALDPEPVSRAALGLASAGLFLGMSADRAPSGTINSRVQIEEGRSPHGLSSASAATSPGSRRCSPWCSVTGANCIESAPWPRAPVPRGTGLRGPIPRCPS